MRFGRNADRAPAMPSIGDGEVHPLALQAEIRLAAPSGPRPPSSSAAPGPGGAAGACPAPDGRGGGVPAAPCCALIGGPDATMASARRRRILGSRMRVSTAKSWESPKHRSDFDTNRLIGRRAIRRAHARRRTADARYTLVRRFRDTTVPLGGYGRAGNSVPPAQTRDLPTYRRFRRPESANHAPSARHRPFCPGRHRPGRRRPAARRPGAAHDRC